MGIFDFFKKKKVDEEQYLKTVLGEETIEDTKAIHSKPQSINDIYAQKKENFKKQFYEDTDAAKDLFDFIFKYSEYVVLYLNMMFRGNHSPIAAYETVNGDFIGYLFVAEDMSYNLSVEQVIEKMEIEFEKRIAENTISSWTIFYHSEFN